MPNFRRGAARDGAGGEPERPSQEERTSAPLNPFAGIPERRYHISAAELLRPNSAGMLRWRKQTTNAPIILVEDAYITGRLDLRAANFPYLLRFERCRFEYPPDVREATVLG